MNVSMTAMSIHRSLRCLATPARVVPATVSALLVLAGSPALDAQERSDSATAPLDCTSASIRTASLADPAADRARMAGIAGLTAVRPHLIRRTSRQLGLHRTTRVERSAPCRAPNAWHADPANPQLTPLPARLTYSQRSGYPRDANEGAPWTGRGATVSLTAGVALRWGPAALTIAPTAAYQQNAAVRTVPNDVPNRFPLAHPWQPIDRPQRFGWTPFWTFHPGQSRLAVRLDDIEFGVSSENLWWGPARRYPLLMSNTAPGFPHVYVGTPAPIETPLGRVEAEAVWGRLAESDFFDGDPTNDHRLLGGLVVDIEPRGVPGLYLGFGRTFVAAPSGDDLAPTDAVIAPFIARDRDVAASPHMHPDLRLVSFFARWAVPDAGFEVYTEWARQGEWPDLATLLREPGAGAALTLGTQQVVNAGERRIRIGVELTSLGQAGDARNTRIPETSFYAGAGGPQGYTHRGQILGAWVGPGADAQFLQVDLFDDDGGIGAFLERVRFDDDAYFATWAPEYAYHGHDAELGGGLHRRSIHGAFEWSVELGFSRRWNRGFADHDGLDHEARSEDNWTLEVDVAWRPGIGP